MNRLDRDVEQLVSEHGIADVIAALARYANNKGMPVIFRRLNKIYEYLRPANDYIPLKSSHRLDR